jgi:P-type Cu2+ transporter
MSIGVPSAAPGLVLPLPAVGPAVATSDEPHEVFDDPDEWAQFSQPMGPDQTCWQSQVRVEGMHCAACAFAVEQALTQVPGVQSVKVSSAAQRASIVWSPQATRPSQWLNATRSLGYRLRPDLDHALSDENRRASRLMLWRWLVAGFCMMQVMMYAYPAYIAEPGTITPDIEQLLRWASWVLSLPVLLFSSRPFFASAWRDLTQRSMSMDLPVALGLIITFAISSAATFEPNGWWGQEVYFDSLTMFVFFLLTGRWLELRLRERTAGSLDALMQRLPLSVERQQADGSFTRVAARRLHEGDVVRVLAGEAFAADGQITRGQSHVDESLLTGESRALPRRPGDVVLAGSYNLSGTVLMRVQRLGPSTRYAQIVALMQQAAVDKPRLALLADRIARPFLWVVLLTALAAVLLWWNEDPARGLMAAVAVLVVTCPCALSLATPSAMLTAAGWLARQGVLMRRLQALEVLQRVDTVLFDKTGTLTQARLGLHQVELSPVRRGWTDAQALQVAAALARHSLHPVSQALVEQASMLSPEMPWTHGVLTQLQEVPGQGLQALAEGSAWPSDVKGQLRLGQAGFCGVPADSKVQVLQVCLADDHGLIARFYMDEVLREDAVDVIRVLRRAGLEVQLLSGDRDASVQHLAARVGLPPQHVRSQCTPQDKLSHLKALQAQGRRVLMVGDGLNDGPVLAQADVSMAMGPSVPLAQAQADIVVPSGNLGVILLLRQQAQLTLRIVGQNLIWAAAYNAISVPLALTGGLPAWAAGLGMALSSLLVVLNASRLSISPASRRLTEG